MSEGRYRPTHLGQMIETQGRTRRWVARQAGISPGLLSLAINGQRTLSESAARRMAEVLQAPFGLLFESAHADDSSATTEVRA